MIVTCERCEQRYRIKADKLPSQGGKIRCPTCRHVFVVRPGEQGGDEDIALPGPTSGAAPASGPLPEPPHAAGAGAKAEEKPAEAATEAAEAKTWKLRVAGLTYAFQTLDSLQNWLLARDNVDTIKVAREGEPWAELGDYPEVLTLQLRTKFFAGGSAPMGQSSGPAPKVPTGAPDLSSPLLNSVAKAQAVKAKPRKQRAAPKPRVRSKESATPSSTRAGVMIGVAFLLVLGAFVAHMTGLIDLGTIIPGMKTPTSEITQTKPPGEGKADRPDPGTNETKAGGPRVVADDTPIDNPETAPPIDDGPSEEELFLEAFGKGQPLVEERRWAEARAYLEPWLSKRPDDLELNIAMMKVYKGLGVSDKHGEVKKKVTQLKKEARQREKEEKKKKKSD